MASCFALFVFALMFVATLHATPLSKSDRQPLRKEPSLRELFCNHFEVGFGTGVPNPQRTALVRHHASVVSCENDLKAYSLLPAPGRWSWDKADAWLGWAESMGLTPIGHTLVWCHQMPGWLQEGIKAGEWSRERALKWQEDYIKTVLSRYGSRVLIWDVVNEALSDSPHDPKGEEFLRSDPWSDLCGVEYIVEAFRSARKAAPKARLFYNDYGLENPAKRARLFKLLKILEENDCRPDAIGIQGHYRLDDPTVDAIEETILDIHKAGYPVHITELDVSIHKWNDEPDLQLTQSGEARLQTSRTELPQPIVEHQTARYREIFEVFLRHSDKIERVGFWNTDDGNSWLNNFPVKGRPDYPLLFDENLAPKPAFEAVRQLAEDFGISVPDR